MEKREEHETVIALNEFVRRIAAKEGATAAELEAMAAIACKLMDMKYYFA